MSDHPLFSFYHPLTRAEARARARDVEESPYHSSPEHIRSHSREHAKGEEAADVKQTVKVGNPKGTQRRYARMTEDFGDALDESMKLPFNVEGNDKKMAEQVEHARRENIAEEAGAIEKPGVLPEMLDGHTVKPKAHWLMERHGLNKKEPSEPVLRLSKGGPMGTDIDEDEGPKE